MNPIPAILQRYLFTVGHPGLAHCPIFGLTNMSLIKRVVLDVLKPHQPNALEFAGVIADRHSGCRVKV
ncbi:MAG: DUF211 domain-containing protein, partial [Thiogranum sp.]